MYDVCVYVYSMCPSSAHSATDGKMGEVQNSLEVFCREHFGLCTMDLML